MERACILSNDVKAPAQRAKRPPMKTVAVGRTHDIWSGLVDSSMDHERGRVQQSAITAPNHFSFVVDLDKITSLDQRECDAKRIHPKSRRIDRISKGNVAGDAFIEATESGLSQHYSFRGSESDNTYYLPKILNAAASLPLR